MEEVEQANRVAVESCHRVLSLLSQPRDQVQHRNLMVEVLAHQFFWMALHISCTMSNEVYYFLLYADAIIFFRC